jgi:gamma-glutamyltranspeptidase/glutathione hydrolase
LATFKEPVVASRGVITTNHPEASAAGLEMLAMGGNAIDAAVAALFSLSVVEPMMVSPMGAGFFVIRHGETGEVTTLDNYSTAPAAARADMFDPVPGSLENETVGLTNDVGHLSVGTPGALAGWISVAERFGRLPLDVLIGPAIRQARRGFVVSPYLAFCIESEQSNLARFPASAEIFLSNGRVPEVGDRIVREEYAQTLERIAVNGADEFVTGKTADLILEEMERGGGLLTRADLAGYELKERAPVRGTYRGHEIVALGPVSSGGTHIVQMLKMLEGYDLAAYGFGSVERVHLVAEALKIAFADRFRYMADPAEVDIPVDHLISHEYADLRRAEMGPPDGMAKSYLAGAFGSRGESTSTTHLNVADADGNVVSATQTLNSLFGSRVTAAGTGLLLNNTMRNLDPVPGRTNSIAPGKRILSSMSPTLVLKDGQPVLAIGTPGGHRIFAAVLQGIMNVIDFGMTAQEAVEAPRIWTMGPVLEIEDTFPDLANVVSGLEARGHTVSVVAKIAGGMSAIALDPASGLMTGAACWRADGAPAGLSGGGARLVNETVWK